MVLQILFVANSLVGVMSHKYKNPPIVEALCEFRFTQSGDWPLTIHGAIFSKLQSKLPKSRNAQNIQFSTQIGPGGVAQQSQTQDKTILLTEDERSLVQVAPHQLVVNRLKPYQTWNDFLPLIQESFRAYLEVAHPNSLRQIILRYINRIEFDEDASVPVETYFEFRPYLGSKLKTEMNGFAQVVQFAQNDGRDLATVTLSTTDLGDPAVMLDLEYATAHSEPIELDKVFEWVELAHTHIEDLFEACITDTLRQRFGGLQS